MAARALHQVRDALHAQPVPAWPVEGWTDPLTGQRLRRVYLGGCAGGQLIIGSVTRSSGLDLYFRRLMGSPLKPRAGELDADLRRFITQCWHEQLRKPGGPVLQRQGQLWWLARMPCGTYHVESGGAGSLLFRYMPLVCRPRAALPVALAGSGSAGDHRPGARLG